MYVYKLKHVWLKIVENAFTSVNFSSTWCSWKFLILEFTALAPEKIEPTNVVDYLQLDVPVHISAAVLNGPNHNAAPSPHLDATRFLRLAKSHYPKATVVLGWADGAPTDAEVSGILYHDKFFVLSLFPHMCR